MQITGKNQWYDGNLYGWFFDPIETANRRMIADLIPEGSTVLDVCCGTGRLAMELAGKCRYVTGVDYSRRMIAFCRKRQKKNGIKNLEFLHADAARLEEPAERRYDTAVISLAIHEMDEDERRSVLLSMAAAAGRVIISDHAAPLPATLPGFLVMQMERFIGGRENFALFKEYLATGGIAGAMERCGLIPDSRRLDRYGIRQVVTAACAPGDA